MIDSIENIERAYEKLKRIAKEIDPSCKICSSTSNESDFEKETFSRKLKINFEFSLDKT